ncbi:hypothetical protein SAMN05444411_101270 [Lutibacter oricola]|uniref:Uncharacterized protein n=1 Tax=Lutibacter oricola TaxID=762486 RepID=A0A1H2RN51_9FLAO|nr:hypothetical protein [Lutibacter oricola]SDW20184.1 hypothetical protein SAMN05444411_101270 [Lutibacter oricola]
MKVKAITIILFFISINIYCENIYHLEFIDFGEHIENTFNNSPKELIDLKIEGISIKKNNEASFLKTNWKYLITLSLFLTYITITLLYMYKLSLPTK